MSVILITANFKFRNRSTCSKGPIKRAGKVRGDFQDLKSPGCVSKHTQSQQNLKDFNDVISNVIQCKNEISVESLTSVTGQGLQYSCGDPTEQNLQDEKINSL